VYALPSAAEPGVQDFARGAEIVVAQPADLYRIDVPDDVYRTVTRADLSDLRVFNAQGRGVAHTLREPAVRAGAPIARALPFFPLQGAPRSDAAAEHTRVEVDAAGTVIEVVRTPETESPVRAWLIDASALSDSIEQLSFDWTGADEKGFLIKVDIDASNDLRGWRSVTAAAPLAELRHAGAVLRQATVRVPATRAAYLRVSWPAPRLRIASVDATLAPAKPVPENRWLEITGSPEPDRPEALRYDTGGLWPIARIGVGVSDGPAFLNVRVASRGANDAAWRTRYSGAFYRLEIDGEVLSRIDAPITPTTDPYWRVEFAGDAAPASQSAPVLRLGYRPHELVFLGRGPAPYLLAYGSIEAGAAGERLDDLLSNLPENVRATGPVPARIGQPRDLGGAAALRPAPPPVPWRKFVLWAVLIAAVVLLGLLARRVYRDLDVTPS
jgi:hypothetical protein